MTKGLRGALLRMVRAANVSTDRELLIQFTAGDAEAFAELVRRHSAMVFGVCRRVLPTVQEAEDACQATFLILLKHAKDGRFQESIANWLYTAARRVASKANRTAARRARWEARAAPRTNESPLDHMTGREVLAALDQELDRLPARYREPLVLCYLEGLTRDEAAKRLGVPTSTLKSQLERGRKKLTDALTKRGLTLGVGLFVIATSIAAGAPQPHLVELILTAVSGRVPAAVGGLVKGVTMHGSFYKSFFTLAAIAIVSLGTGLWSLGMMPTTPLPNKSSSVGVVQSKDMPEKAWRKTVTLSGRVLDPDGKPLAGAKLFAAPAEEMVGVSGFRQSRNQVDFRSVLPNERLREVGAAGADGKFAVKVPASEAALALVARAEGMGTAFVNLSADRFGAEVELRTVKDQAIRGRVVDTQGQPIAGAMVSVAKLDIHERGIDGFLAAAMRPGSPPARIVESLRHSEGVVPSVISDKDGRFTIIGAGAERLVTLRVGKDGLADTELVVVNRRDFDPKPYNDDPVKADAIRLYKAEFDPDTLRGILPPILHGPDVAAIVESEKPIRGAVTDIDTGKPVGGLTVTLLRHGSTVTDAEGRYEIRRSRKSPNYVITVDADPNTRHVAARAQVDDTAGYEPLTADIKVKQGVVITGKMTDAVTKKPIRGYVAVAVMRDNEFVNKYPAFIPAFRGVSLQEVSLLTNEDGTFRVVTIPGPVLLFGGVSDTTTQYKRAVADPNYPQYFSEKLKTPEGSDVTDGYPSYFGVGFNQGFVRGNFCKVLTNKAENETVTQDILLEPSK